MKTLHIYFNDATSMEISMGDGVAFNYMLGEGVQLLSVRSTISGKYATVFEDFCESVHGKLLEGWKVSGFRLIDAGRELLRYNGEYLGNAEYNRQYNIQNGRNMTGAVYAEEMVFRT